MLNSVTISRVNRLGFLLPTTAVVVRCSCLVCRFPVPCRRVGSSWRPSIFMNPHTGWRHLEGGTVNGERVKLIMKIINENVETWKSKRERCGREAVQHTSARRSGVGWAESVEIWRAKTRTADKYFSAATGYIGRRRNRFSPFFCFYLKTLLCHLSGRRHGTVVYTPSTLWEEKESSDHRPPFFFPGQNDME